MGNGLASTANGTSCDPVYSGYQPVTVTINGTTTTSNVAVTAVDWENEYGEYSNHCYKFGEFPVWWGVQVLLFIGYTFFGGLSTQYGLHRYRSQGKFRFTMILAFIVMVVWAGAFGMAIDQLIAAAILIFINLYHQIMCVLFDKSISVNPYLMNLYHKMFDHDSINLEDVDFYNLVQEKAFLKTYKKGQTYMHEHDIPCQLSILLHGKMSIHKHDGFQKNRIIMRHESTHAQRYLQSEEHGEAFVGMVYPYEFIDSYEWLSQQGQTQVGAGVHHSGGHNVSQVTIRVADCDDVTECVVLTWPKERLESVFKEFPRLRTCIHAVVGKDIAEKMLRITGHTTFDNVPSSDMIRRAHGALSCTRLADIAYRKGITLRETQVLPNMAKRAVYKFDEEYTVTTVDYDDEPGWFGFQKSKTKVEIMHNLSGKQRQIKNVLGAGPWCELPDSELSKEPWTTHLKTVAPDDLENFYTDEGYCTEEQFSGFVPIDDEDLPMKPDSDFEKGMKQFLDGNLDKFNKSAGTDFSNARTLGPDKNMRCLELAKMTYIKEKASEYAQKFQVKGVPREGDFNHHLLEQAMHSLQRSRLRIANARLLAMHPAPMDSLSPAADMMNMSNNSALSGDLLHYFDMVCKDLRKKDLHEILKWGKWRSYFRPGTVVQKQGEEANYVGILLQGKLASYTEDELTRHKTLVSYVEKYNLVGSEDFSSKFRTARRTIQMPEYDPDHKDSMRCDDSGRKEEMYQVMKIDEAKERLHKATKELGSSNSGFGVGAGRGKDSSDTSDTSDTDDSYTEDTDTYDDETEYEMRQLEHLEDLQERVDNYEGNKYVLLTKIPAILFVWDIKDLKRLMLADPHVESHLSKILRGDISHKLDNAIGDSLGTRVCGVPTQARGDQDVRLCNVSPE